MREREREERRKEGRKEGKEGRKEGRRAVPVVVPESHSHHPLVRLWQKKCAICQATSIIPCLRPSVPPSLPPSLPPHRLGDHEVHAVLDTGGEGIDGRERSRGHVAGGKREGGREGGRGERGGEGKSRVLRTHKAKNVG